MNQAPPNRFNQSQQKALSVQTASPNKAQTVQLSGLGKQLLFGNEEQKRMVMVALQEGNSLAQDQSVQDLQNMNAAQIAVKYGNDVANQLGGMTEPTRDIAEIQFADRDLGQEVGDAALDVGSAVTGFAGSIAALGAEGVDTVLKAPGEALARVTGNDDFRLDLPSAGPAISAWTQDAREVFQGAQSQELQDRRGLLGLKGELDRQDRIAERQMVDGNWWKQQADAIVDTVENYAQDPAMVGSIAAEGVGYMAPSTALIRMLGGLKAVAGVSSMTEAGAGLMQAQQEIMGMDLEELQKVPEFQDLLARGYDEKGARREIASQAGKIAGAIGATTGYATGYMGRAFEVNPFNPARVAGLPTAPSQALGASAGRAARSFAVETTQEGIEEGLNTIASNVGVDVAGVDTAWTEGLGEAIGEGIVGGAGMTGVLAAPGAVAGTTKEVYQNIASVGKTAVEKRLAQVNDQVDAETTVGRAAQEAAARDMTTNLDTIVNRFSPDETSENTDTPVNSFYETKTPVRTKLRDASFIPADENEAMVGMFPSLAGAQTKTGRIGRADVITAISQTLESPELDEPGQALLSVALFENYDAMRQVVSDEMQDIMEKGSPDTKAALQKIQEDMATLESNGALDKAKEIIQGVNEETLREIMDFSDLDAGKTDTPNAKGVITALKMVARYNPTAVNPDDFKRVNDQLSKSGSERDRRVAKVMKTVADITRDVRKLIAERVAIGEDDGTKKTALEVTEEIMTTSFTSDRSGRRHKSIVEHNAGFQEDFESGKLEEAQGDLEELRNFAQSQINKLKAMSESAREGKGRKKSFEAYDGDVFYSEDDTRYMPYAQLNSAKSMRQVQRTIADTKILVRLYNTLLDQYGEDLGELSPALQKGLLMMPEMEQSIQAKIDEMNPVDPKKAEQRAYIAKRQQAPLSRPNQQAPGGLFSEAETKQGDLSLVPLGPMAKPRVSDLEAQMSTYKPLTRKKKREMLREAGGARPIIDLILGAGGVRKDSDLHRELRARGMTGQNVPGKKFFVDEGGIGHIDDLTIEEIKGFAELIGETNDDLVDAVQDEAFDKDARPYTWEMQEAAEELARSLELDEYMDRMRSDPEFRNTELGITETEATEVAVGSSQNADQQGSSNSEEAAGEQDSAGDGSGQGGSSQAKKAGEDASEGSDQGDGDRSGDRPPEDSDSTGKPPARRADDGVPRESEDGPRDPQTLEEAFPDLKDTPERPNYFLRAFSLVKGASTLLAQSKPYEAVLKAIGQGQLVLDDDQGRDLIEFRKQVAAFRNVINKRMTEAYRDPSKKWAERLGRGEDIFAWKNSMGLNFAVINEETQTVEVDPRVLDAGIMAAFQWMFRDEATGTPRLDKKSLKKLFNLQDEKDVETKHREIAKKGRNLQNGIDSISQGMESLMGIKQNPDVTTNLTQGMTRGFAATILEVMNDAKWITVNSDSKVDFVPDGKGGTKSWFTITHPTEGAIATFRTRFAKTPDIFDSVFRPEYTKTRYVGEAPKTVSKTIMGQRSNLISRMQKKVLKKLTNTEFYLVAPMVTFFEALGESEATRLIGFEDMSQGVYNKAHALSVDGKNRGLVSAYRSTMLYVSDARNMTNEYESNADTSKRAWTPRFNGSEYRVPIFFSWGISSVGRLQQDGPITPQGNKFARGLISATESILDLTKGEDYKAVMLAIAQALDIKPGVEKQAHDDTVLQVETLLEGDLAGLLDVVGEWIQTGEMPSDMVDQFHDAGVKKTEAAVHAIITAAEMKLTPEEEKTNFRTNLSIEYDGKTDGPINAMMNMATGVFTRRQVDVLAKGGMYFGTQLPMSLNDYVKKVDSQDLYNVAASIFERNIKNRLADFIDGGSTQEAEATVRTLRMLDRFLPKMVTFKTQSETESGSGTELTFGRDMVKNPLTVFIYGSGQEGISGKIAGELMDKFHELLTTIADGDPNVDVLDLPIFKNTTLLQDMEEMMGKDLLPILRDPVNQTFEKRRAQLQAYIDETIGEGMTEAINEATGSLRNNMQVLQAASQIQAIKFADIYKKMIKEREEKRLSETGPRSIKKGEMLSQADLREVFEEASKIAPIYTSDVQEFHVATSEKYSSKQYISESISGKLSSGGTIPNPSEPGVRVSPYLIIGTGDGMMMMNIYSGEIQGLDKSLAVFDGVETNLLGLKKKSEGINKAVYKGWANENVAGMVGQSFRQTMRLTAKTELSPQAQADIKKIWKSLKNKKIPISSEEQLNQGLLKMELENKARKRAMDRMTVSVDHMAVADAAYHEAGNGRAVVEMETYDAEAVAQKLNEFYVEERKKLLDEAKEKFGRTAVQEQSETMADVVDLVGQPTGIAGTKTLGLGDVFKALRDAENLTSEQTELLKELESKPDLFDGYQFFFGSPSGLETLKQFKIDGDAGGEIQAGQMFPNEKMVFIANMSPETVLHEMVHVATVKRIQDYYSDTSDGYRVNEALDGSMKRLEALMAQVEEMSFPGMSGIDRAGRKLQEVLSGQPNTLVEEDSLIDEGDDGGTGNTNRGNLTGKALQAHKMSEFLSWMTSNQNLMELGKQTQVRSPLAKIGQKVMMILKKVLGIKNNAGKDLLSNVKFNMSVVMTTPDVDRLAQTDARSRLYFEQTYGEDEKMDMLERQYWTQLGTILESTIETDAGVESARDLLIARGLEAAQDVQESGFDLNERQVHLFRAIYSVMSVGSDLNAPAMRQVKRIFQSLSEQIAASDDPVVKEKWDKLTTKMLIRDRQLKKDATLLPSFIALTQTSPEIQQMLEDLPAPKKKVALRDERPELIDGMITRVADATNEWLTSSALSKTMKSANGRVQMAALADALKETRADQRLAAERIGFKVQNGVNKYVSSKMKTGAEATGKWLQSKRIKNKGKKPTTRKERLLDLTLNAGTFISALGSKEASEAQFGALLELMTRVDGVDEIQALMNDLIGGTEDSKIAGNFGLLKLMNQARAEVDAVRQDSREQIPHLLAKAFNKKRTEAEWADMQKIISYLDLSILGKDEAIALLEDPSSVSQKIKDAEAELKALDGSYARHYIVKAKGLARFMQTQGEVESNNFLPNAYAIARLVGEENARSANEVSKELVAAIDKLTTLYAFERSDQALKDRMSVLTKAETNGIGTVLNYHKIQSYWEMEARVREQQQKERDQKAAERDDPDLATKNRQKTRGKRNVEVMLLNSFKGYTPEIGTTNGRIRLVPDKDGKKLLKQGHVRVGDYKGPGLDTRDGKWGYYKPLVSNQAAFRQGTAQTVHFTAKGADPITGMASGRNAVGKIHGRKARKVQNLRGKVVNGTLIKEAVTPVFGSDGQIVGWNRMIDPELLKDTPRDEHFGRNLGAWTGRLLEERQADKFNSSLMKELKRVYDYDKAQDVLADEMYVNLAKSKDPVHQEVWATLGQEIKNEAEELFGKEKFMVRRDQLLDAVGTRAYSVREFWGDEARMNDTARKAVSEAAMAMMGKDAYRYMVNAEEFVQGAVSYAKQTIIIRSVVVMYQNTISNVLHLASHGMGPIEMAKVLTRKYIETNQYMNNQERLKELQFEIIVLDEGQPAKLKQLKAEEAMLNEANRKLSIWPLIEAGEFNTIAEGLTESDMSSRGGPLDWVRNAVDKLPPTPRNVVDTILISNNTALYKALNRAVQYGDFVAKAALYDHLLQKQVALEKNPKSRLSQKVKTDQDFIDVAKGPITDRLKTASSEETPAVDNALLAEMGDVGVLLDLLDVSYKQDAVTKAPSEKDLLSAQKRLLEIYAAVKNDPKSFDKYKGELGKLMGWFTSEPNQTVNDDRRARAEKHAKKYGKGNPKAHLMVQLIEELSEVLAERDRLVDPKGNTMTGQLEVQKRALKVLRFGGDTVNKGPGPYEGKTNLQAFEQVVEETEPKVPGGMTPEEAMKIITEEFVNYNRLAGRGRDYMESMGLLWFFNYKLRIMKVMGRMIRDRPATALLYAGGVGPWLDVDSVVSGSLPGAVLDGRVGYSVGPEMGLNAWTLNPFFSMFR